MKLIYPNSQAKPRNIGQVRIDPHSRLGRDVLFCCLNSHIGRPKEIVTGPTGTFVGSPSARAAVDHLHSPVFDCRAASTQGFNFGDTDDFLPFKDNRLASITAVIIWYKTANSHSNFGRQFTSSRSGVDGGDWNVGTTTSALNYRIRTDLGTANISGATPGNNVWVFQGLTWSVNDQNLRGYHNGSQDVTGARTGNWVDFDPANSRIGIMHSPYDTSGRYARGDFAMCLLSERLWSADDFAFWQDHPYEMLAIPTGRTTFEPLAAAAGQPWDLRDKYPLPASLGFGTG